MLDRSTMVHTAADARARHGADLTALVGQTIGSSWVAWDLDDDTWFDDEAVIVQIGPRRLEVVWMYFDALSITWDHIDLDAPPAFVSQWAGDDGGLRLEWRRDALEPLRAARGHTIESVAFAETTFTTRPADADPAAPERTVWMLNAIELRHTGGTLMIFNDLDKNGVSTETADSPILRRIVL